MEAAAVKFDKMLDKLDGKVARVRIEAENKGANAALDETERKREALDGKTARVKVEIDKRKFSDAANAWALLARNMRTLALPGAIALATPTVLALGQAAATASQSLLLLPAAGAAAGIALGTVKLAAIGLDDAFKALGKGDMEAFAAALAKLSPAARDFALAVQAVKPAFDSMRLDVQNALFNNFGATLRDLAGTYMPIVKAGATGIATELNSAALQAAAFVREAQTTRDVQTIFGNTRIALQALSPAGAAILQIFRDIATVGSQFLPGLAGGFTTLTQKAADFVARARETGRLREWMQSGLDALTLLGQTFINVGGIIAAIYRALNSDSESFLTKLRDMTGQVRDFLNSAQGQQILVDVFTKLRDLGSALAPLFGAIGLAILQMFQQLAPALPPLIQGITDVFNASGSLLGVFGELLTVILPPLGAALSALSPILGPLLMVITAITVAMKLYNTTVAIVEAVTKAWAIAQAILNGALIANPIGIVVVALAALAAALIYAYNHSETFRQIVQAAWAGIQQAAQFAWSILQGIFTAWSTVIGTMAAAITWFWQSVVVPAWNAIAAGVSERCAFITAIWNAIVGFLYGAFAAAFNFIRDLIILAWNLIRDGINAAWTFIRDNIWNPIIGFLHGVFAAAFNFIRDFILLQWNMIRDGLSIVWNWIRDNIWNPMVRFITETIPDGFRRGVEAVGRLWDGIKRALRDPLQAAIDVVWNNGIVKVWNWVVDLVHVGGHLNPYNLPGFAAGGVWAGGVLPGNTPGRDVHRFVSPTGGGLALSGGEAIMRPEFTTALGARNVDSLNKVAAISGPKGVRAFLATGGEQASDFRRFATGAAGLAFARSQAGKPYVWGGVGPGGYDCSGFQSAITNVLLDQNPYSRRFSTGSFGANRGAGGLIPGFGTYTIGVTPNAGGGIGHTAGTLMGVNVESRGGQGVVVGPGARGADNGMFPWHFFLPQAGNQFVSGGSGGFFDPVSWILSSIGIDLRSIADKIPRAVGPWGELVVGFGKTIATTVWDAVVAKVRDWASSVGNFLGIGGGGAAGGGGGDREWIISRESGGNPRAQNPTSSASGLYQMIDSTWRAYGGTTAHAKDASVAEQNAVADRYVAARYGSWAAAAAFWRSHGYYSRGGILPMKQYDSGGMLPTGLSLALNRTGRPEPVIPATRAGGNDTLLTELQRLNRQLGALRGDVDHHGDQAGIAAQIAMTNRLLTGMSSGSAATDAQDARRISVLGAF